MNKGPKTASKLASETGSGSITPAIIAQNPGPAGDFPALKSRRHAAAQAGPASSRHEGGRPVIMDSVPDTPDSQTRTAVTQRIIAHVTRGWPHLDEPIVRHRGRFCYVSARLPGEREPAPILRLRYQGSADQWAIGIYLASNDRYTESELPTSFGPKTGTPEEGVDDTFILYAGPKTGH